MDKIYYNHSSGNHINGLKDIIDTLKNKTDTALVIAPGIYEIASPLAVETQRKVMNGEYGKNPEKMMFNPSYEYSKGLDLSGLSDITVDAYGVTLLIDGFMEPVSITNCKNVTVKGLTIDHKRKPYSKAIIKSSEFTDRENGSGYMTVIFGKQYPVNKNTPMPRACIFDCNANRFTLYGEAKIDASNGEEISPQVWRFSFRNIFEDFTDNEIYVWHTFHSRPAILIENSVNTELTDVTIHSQPGMGIVAHRCDNLLFRGLRVISSCGEHMSTNTDATHITSCKGTVEYDSCQFDGQGDDSLNIHTYYHKIENTGSNTARIYLDAPTGTHSQSADYPDCGDVLELTDAFSLAPLDTYTVVKCNNIDARSSDLVLDKPLPQSCEGLYFANASRQAHLYFHDCICRNHLARSVLSKTKYARIENNQFIDVVGTAICIIAEGFWREGVCSTEDVVISRNRISFCGRTNSIRQGNSAGITVSLCAVKPYSNVHKSIIITDNIIDCPHAPHGIYISNTENLTLERNSVISKSEPIMTETFAEPDV